jgi:propanediol dehydratase large subunit
VVAFVPCDAISLAIGSSVRAHGVYRVSSLEEVVEKRRAAVSIARWALYL